jgi:hypothetical protein
MGRTDSSRLRVVVRAEMEDADIAAATAAGLVGPETIFVAIRRFDPKLRGTPLRDDHGYPQAHLH